MINDGLSPRVRGKLIGVSRFALLNAPRSIPACAGETRMSTIASPRLDNGLSPRVRGKPSAQAEAEIVQRLPVYPRVCGGNRVLAASLARAFAMVYPRVCGGTHRYTRMQVTQA